MRFLPLVLLMACNGPSGVSETDRPPRDTDEDDEDTDGGDTDEEPTPDPTKCPPYTGLRDKGRTWNWKSTPAFVAENDFSNTWKNTLVTLTPQTDHADVVVTTDGVSDIEDVDEATFTTTVTMRCDADGLWLLDTQFAYEYVVFGFADDGYVNSTWTSPELVWKRGAGVGDTWTTPSEGTTDSSEDGTSTFANSVTYTVVEETQTTVTAGTFTTVKVEAVSTADNKTLTSFVDKDLGAVLSDVGELLGSAP